MGLTPEFEAELKKEFEEGMSILDLYNKYGINENALRLIIFGDKNAVEPERNKAPANKEKTTKKSTRKSTKKKTE